MNFKPSGTWIVLPDPVITETESGIILDEATAMENSKRSNVLEALAVGPNCHFVEKGDMMINLAAMPIVEKGMVNTLRVSLI